MARKGKRKNRGQQTKNNEIKNVPLEKKNEQPNVESKIKPDDDDEITEKPTTTAIKSKDIVTKEEETVGDDQGVMPKNSNNDAMESDASSESDSSSDDDSLVLEGTLQRIEGVSSSSDSDDSDDDDDDDDDDESPPMKPPQKKTKMDKTTAVAPKAKKLSLKEKDDITNVEFIFCDMHEKYFHGLKTFLQSNPVHALHSSSLSDLLIENVSVGTVVGIDYDTDHCVYGFASVINLTVDGESPGIKAAKELCLKHCPEEHKKEVEVVLSGRTQRPAGLFLHDRMMNLPLEITRVLHQQLVLDIDWAVKNAEGGKEERQSLDFGVFVRMAPCTRDDKGGGGLVYKHFDDEIFATNAEVVYTFDAPKGFASEMKQFCTVIVISKTGHQKAMEELDRLIG